MITPERLAEIELAPREAMIFMAEAKELADAYRNKSQGEPVAWMHKNDPLYIVGSSIKNGLCAGGYKDYTVPLYTSAPTIPEGYVLVPFYPSENMMESARLSTEAEGITTTTWLRRAVWDAMIVAAIRAKE